MALASAKQLLDELMGRDRNLTPNDKGKNSQWDLPDVCKHFLVKFCPNELFVNTKADLGPCSKVHDEKIRKDYEKSSRYKQMGYEEDFLRFCQVMLSDVEKRIRRAKQRLALGNQDGTNSSIVAKSSDEKTQVLSERINELLEQVEHLGCEGKVEEAQGIMKLCEQLRDEREAMRKSNEPSHWLQQTAEIAAAQEKQMEVCEVCGAFLIVGDAQQRVDDHLMGKQHVGYAKLKAAVEEILHKREKEKEDREKQREKEREDKQRLKEEEDRAREERRKQAEEGRRREKDKRRSRSRDRMSSNRTRHRSRSRGRSRDEQRHHPSHRSSGHSSRSSHRHSRDSRRSRSHSRSRESSKRSRRSRSPSSGTKKVKQSHNDSSSSKRGSSSSSPKNGNKRDNNVGKNSTEVDTPSVENGDSSSIGGGTGDKESPRLDD